MTGVFSLPNAYAELCAKSYFSFLEGTSSPEQLVRTAARLGLSAIALTDTFSVAGWPRFERACKKHDIHPVAGATVRLDQGSELVLLVENACGWRSLCRLLSLAHGGLDTVSDEDWVGKVEPALLLDQVLEHIEGLFIICPARRGPRDEALTRLAGAMNGRIWQALTDQRRADDAAVNLAAAMRAEAAGMPMVVTGDVLYHAHAYGALGDVLCAIRHHMTLTQARAAGVLAPNHQAFLRGVAGQLERFPDLKPEITQSAAIARTCQFSLDLKHADPPPFPGVPDADEALARKCWHGFESRYEPDDDEAKKRLTRELGVIREAGLASYFLHAAALCEYAEARGIKHSGRGSAAGAIVSYCLDISQLCPLQFNLSFERFLNPQRSSPVDIDLDFDSDRRDEVIRHALATHGRAHAALVCIHVEYSTRLAMRELAKVLEIPPDTASRYAQLHDRSSPHGAADAIDAELDAAGVPPGGRHPLRIFCRLLRQIGGLPRHRGQHPGGVVFTREPLCEWMPIERATMPGRYVVQLDKDDLDDLGMPKLDLLGLRVLTLIAEVERFLALDTHRVRQDQVAALTGVQPAGDAFLPAADRAGMDLGAGAADSAVRASATNGVGSATGAASRALVLPPAGRTLHSGQNGPRAAAPTPGSDGAENVPPVLDGRINLHALAGANYVPDARNHRWSARAGYRIEDDPVWKQLEVADAIGLFQVQSRAQIQLIDKTKPRDLMELAIQIAIIRPGPIAGGLLKAYVDRKRGFEPVRYLHPSLEAPLKRTLGVPIFQENLMDLAQTLAGFSAADADSLRRAANKKHAAATLDGWGKRFVEGCLANGIDAHTAVEAFGAVRGFAAFGFLLSHSASFARLSYMTMWLKHFYPLYFYVGLLNSESGFYSDQTISGDIRRHGFRMLPLDVRESAWKYAPEGNSGIRIGFRTLKHFNEAAFEALALERGKRAFASLRDLAERVKLKRDALYELVRSGALDYLGERRKLLWELGEITGAPDALALEHQVTSVDLAQLDTLESIQWDVETHGLSAEGTQMRALGPLLAAQGYASLTEIRTLPDGARVKTAAPPYIFQRPPTANGVCFMGLEYEEGLLDVVIWPKIYEQYRSFIRLSPILKFEGRVQRNGLSISLIFERPA